MDIGLILSTLGFSINKLPLTHNGYISHSGYYTYVICKQKKKDMILSKFRELNLQVGEKIYITTGGGEQLLGIYNGKSDKFSTTFSFRNYSNGQTEIIEIEKLHSIRKHNN